MNRHDRLCFEQEAVLAQRMLDARHPLHLAVALRDDRVVFLVDVHAIAALVLRGIAGRIRACSTCVMRRKPLLNGTSPMLAPTVNVLAPHTN